ncbi:hypothetical protein WNY37_05160 [Henriciella sp. AS95]|uniref:hypothetical protein n=1 Tax=Henriciella sp. AS95 TaxID=3135782 RepID=UPI00316D9E7E
MTINGTARGGSKTDVFRPEDSRFSEPGSSSPGARHSDINIVWTPKLFIEDIKGIVFEGWNSTALALGL